MSRRLSSALLLSPALLGLLVACTSSTSGENSGQESADLSIIGRDPPPGPTVVRPPPPPPPPPPTHIFSFHGLSRCWDFGGQASWAPGVGASLYTCNGSVAQQIEVHEVTSARDVELRIHGTNYCLGIHGGHVVVGQPLEIQATCDGSAAQRFALDGDSVLMGAQANGGTVTREYVIEPAGDATANKTPLVVGTRDATDSEYYRLQAVDGSSSPPTSGWKHITIAPWPAASDANLLSALQGGWGMVLDIDQTQTFTINQTINIPPGVTVRGIRKHKNDGPTLTFRGGSGPVFLVDGDNTRITGLRLDGSGAPSVDALEVHTGNGQRILIDHVEVTNWGGSGVNVVGGDGPDNQYNYSSAQSSCDTGTNIPAYPRPITARVLNSWVHQNGDYGIVTGNGAFTYAQGNVLHHNAHSIASDPWRRSGYAAFDNFVLNDPINSDETSNQDFDGHGSGDRGSPTTDSHWVGGIAGDYFDIGWNTFEQHLHYNFNLRGTPCRFAAFHDNVTYRTNPVLNQSVPRPPYYAPICSVFGNQTGVNVADNFGVGDFDGDGLPDLFLGTGVTWWFSSGGAKEWRLLNRMPQLASQVQFRDVDGDGRMDVVRTIGSITNVSWAGQTPWQTLDAGNVVISVGGLSVH